MYLSQSFETEEELAAAIDAGEIITVRCNGQIYVRDACIWVEGPTPTPGCEWRGSDWAALVHFEDGKIKEIVR